MGEYVPGDYRLAKIYLDELAQQLEQARLQQEAREYREARQVERPHRETRRESAPRRLRIGLCPWLAALAGAGRPRGGGCCSATCACGCACAA